MKPSKILALILVIVQVGTVAAFGLSLYTVSTVLANTLSGGGMSFEITQDPATGGGVMQVELRPSNPSYLDADLSLEVNLLDSGGDSIAGDSATAHLAAGASETLSLELQVSPSDMERIAQGGMEPSLEITVGLRTLYDLVGVTNTIRMQGGS